MTASQSLRERPARKLAILIAGLLRVKFSWENTSLVDTKQGGVTTRKKASGSSTGVRISPTPSAQALRPRRKTGTSAPSFTPSSHSCASERSSCHSSLSASSVAAASELPPPSPAPAGRRLPMLIAAPSFGSWASWRSSSAACSIRLSSKGMALAVGPSACRLSSPFGSGLKLSSSP